MSTYCKEMDKYCADDGQYVPSSKPGQSSTLKNKYATDIKPEIPIEIKADDIISLEIENNNVQTWKNPDFITANPRVSDENINGVNIKGEGEVVQEDYLPVENGAPKIEIIEHSLELDNIQVLEDIYRNFNENIAEEDSHLSSEIQEHRVIRKILEKKKPVKKAKNRKKKVQKNTLDNFVNKTRGKTEGKVKKKTNSGKKCLENFERLFVRLEKIDISDKLHTFSESINFNVSKGSNSKNALKTKKTRDKSVVTVATDLKLKNLFRKYETLPSVATVDKNCMINKTESLKIEEMLLKSLKRNKSSIGNTEGTSKKESPKIVTIKDHSPNKGAEKNLIENIHRNTDPFIRTKPELTKEGISNDKKSNVIETQFQCSHCSKFYQNQKCLTRHVKGIHSKLEKKQLPTQYQCNDCGKIVKHRRSIVNHIRQWHTKGVELQCDKCPYVTNLKQALRDHFYRMHVSGDIKPVYKCHLCPHETTYRSCLQIHIKKVHQKKIKTKKCDQCDWEGDVARISIHMKTAHSDEMYYCDNCSFKCKSKGNLGAHQKKHRKVKEFSCPDCSYQTNFNSHLRQHIKGHYNSYKTCPKCLRSVKESNFKDHLSRAHKVRTKEKCPQCGKEVFSLTRHLVVHNGGNEKLKCPECLFSCVSLNYLQLHIKKYHNECNEEMEMEKFICYLCNKELSSKAGLITHLKSVHEDNPGECPICKVKLKSKMYLASHIRTMHNNIKWYECELCPKDKVYRTRHRGGLRNHMLQHQNNEEAIMYKCDNCPFTTKGPNNLSKHIRKRHKKIYKKLTGSLYSY